MTYSKDYELAEIEERLENKNWKWFSVGFLLGIVVGGSPLALSILIDWLT